MMEDRLTRGFFAGLAGGIVMSLLDYISFYLNFSKERRLLNTVRWTRDAGVVEEMKRLKKSLS